MSILGRVTLALETIIGAILGGIVGFLTMILGILSGIGILVGSDKLVNLYEKIINNAAYDIVEIVESEEKI